MIINSVHTLSPGLSQSLTDFRLQLENERASETKNKSTPAKIQSPDVPADTQVDPARLMQGLDRTGEASQARRDVARQAAVQSFEAQHTKDMIETYQKAASQYNEEEGKDDDGVHITTYDPADVYKMTLKYSRRMDLVNAFENTPKSAPDESRINIVI